MDETDEELNNQINDLLYNLDNSPDSVVAQTYKIVRYLALVLIM